MNIAFLFFGQLRWFDLSQKSFKENFAPELRNHNVKYFGHFQGEIDRLNDFKLEYNPSIIEIEKQQSLEETHSIFKMKHKMHKVLLFQTYSFYKTFLILEKYQKENNIKFDLYIKLRTDLVYLNKIDINQFDNHSIYTKDITHWRPLSNYVHDYILFTKSYDNLSSLANLGFGIDEILNKKEELEYTGGPDNDLYCCEEILAKYLSNKNINIKTYDFNIDLARYH